MWMRMLLIAFACSSLTGCMIVQVGVTNPMPELTTVAVVPFFNQSDERAIDGRRVALAYASELQKIPGVEVIPVGVAETKMREAGLSQLSGPSEAIRLARALNADAVVVGSITEYKPYYPPRIGLSVAWYSTRHANQPDTMPVHPEARRAVIDAVEEKHGLGIRRNAKRYWKHYSRVTGRSLNRLADGFFLDDQVPQGFGPFPYEPEPNAASPNNNYPGSGSPMQNVPTPLLKPIPVPQKSLPTSIEPAIFRGQSPSRERTGLELWPPSANIQQPGQTSEYGQHVLIGHEASRTVGSPFLPPRRLHVAEAVPISRKSFPNRRTRPGFVQPVQQSVVPPVHPKHSPMPVPAPKPLDSIPTPAVPPGQSTTALMGLTLKPVMSYTRVFDASDSDLVAIWRDYLETTGDQRSGDWEARLYWSENFLRFTTHLMIVEMFQLHGGEARRRIILKPRKHK